MATKTLKIGTRGSPLALAQAYLTRDLLKASSGKILPTLSCISPFGYFSASQLCIERRQSAANLPVLPQTPRRKGWGEPLAG